MNQLYITMGTRIKSRRKELRLKQSELAEQLDISRLGFSLPLKTAEKNQVWKYYYAFVNY